MTDIFLAAESFGTDLVALDKEWLLAVNGSDSLFLDRVMESALAMSEKEWIEREKKARQKMDAKREKK